MAYDQNNLVRLTTTPFVGNWGLWLYRSADNFATVKAANYLANAYKMGVRPFDGIFVVDTAGVFTFAMIATCTAAPACTMAQTGVVPST